LAHGGVHGEVATATERECYEPSAWEIQWDRKINAWGKFLPFFETVVFGTKVEPHSAP
jgi:hypothetical protein